MFEINIKMKRFAFQAYSKSSPPLIKRKGKKKSLIRLKQRGKTDADITMRINELAVKGRLYWQIILKPLNNCLLQFSLVQQPSGRDVEDIMCGKHRRIIFY